MGNLRLSLSGTHCTGKTTVLDGLQKEKLFTLIPGPTRTLKDKGYPINNDESTNYDGTQLMCLHIDIENLKNDSQFIIQDRCLLDTYIYTYYLYANNKVTLPVFKAIESAWDMLKHQYDAIIVPNPDDIQLVGDKYRNTDIQFRNDINYMFGQELKILKKLPYYVVSGTTEERIEQIKEIAKNILNRNR